MKIYEKLFNIQCEVENLIKDEINKFQRYQYFNEFQVLTKLKPLLEKNKLLLLISDDNQTLEYQKEEKEYLIKYLKNIKIVNVEESKDGSNEELAFNFWATGSNADLAKAKGSAETYAMKYFLSKFFLIPVSDQLDPDLYK
ncbi:MAG: hypothetical protein AM1032_000046 [Mycoplasmataceae bacterium]|nr:MAG: hypothetical protein AM1032_000046 [Mycoplasmataceae bacterium]